jgi:arylsulfatase A-like enzyme
MLPRRQSPNVLMIVADGVGYGDVSFMAESFEDNTSMDAFKATPTLNQLAGSGIVLQAMYDGTHPSSTSADDEVVRFLFV